MLKGLKIIIKMGFTPKKQCNSSQYQVNNLIFPSRHVFSTIKRINRKLRLLYSPAPPNSLWSTINYSSVRDDNEKFEAILDKVEELVDRFDEEVNIIETDDAAFNQEFLGIVNFLYEASDFYLKKEDELSNKTPKYIKERFISIADKLWVTGIHPGEF